MLEQGAHAKVDELRPGRAATLARQRREVALERRREDVTAEARVLAAEDQLVQEAAPSRVLLAVQAEDGAAADRPRVLVQDNGEPGFRAQRLGDLGEAAHLDHLLRGGGADLGRHEDW